MTSETISRGGASFSQVAQQASMNEVKTSEAMLVVFFYLMANFRHLCLADSLCEKVRLQFFATQEKTISLKNTCIKWLVTGYSKISEQNLLNKAKLSLEMAVSQYIE